MFLSYLTLAVALSLSIIAAYYSIAGLVAIFAAAVVPIVVMGSILELAKVVVTLWLHEYWRQCRWLMKAYLVPAVVILMLITSMGIFGFLSKAHTDQGLVSGDVQAKIAIFDEKIKVSRDIIDANRKSLRQLDEAVDQIMGRSTTEAGADKAVAVRRGQQAERRRLLSEIEAEQKKISQLNEQRAPIAAEVRKVEAEVGPIKYIAALIYGDNPDANLLERSVRWVIILLVGVFDPLAIMMLLAATESLKWERERRSKYPPDDGALSQEQLEQVQQSTVAAPTPDLAYLRQGAKMFFDNLKPMVAKPEQTPVAAAPAPVPAPVEHGKTVFLNMPSFEPDSDPDEDIPGLKAAISRWKADHPADTLKNQRAKLARGEIKELPWMAYLKNAPNFGFGSAIPADPTKGDTWIKTNSLPWTLHKFNGQQWIELDKNANDSYTHDTDFVDYLINQISNNSYSTEMLTESEQQAVTQRLQSKK